jgi:hypothetical protein
MIGKSGMASSLPSLAANVRHYVASATTLDGHSNLDHVPFLFAQSAHLMAQHFLLSAAARSFSLGKVARMSERGVENMFARLRGPQTDGKPVCPQCGWDKTPPASADLIYQSAKQSSKMPDASAAALIPTSADQNSWAQSRSPMRYYVAPATTRKFKGLGRQARMSEWKTHTS